MHFEWFSIKYESNGLNVCWEKITKDAEPYRVCVAVKMWKTTNKQKKNELKCFWVLLTGTLQSQWFIHGNDYICYNIFLFSSFRLILSAWKKKKLWRYLEHISSISIASYMRDNLICTSQPFIGLSHFT